MHISSPEKSWWALAGLISLKFSFILPLKSAQLILCFLSKNRYQHLICFILYNIVCQWQMFSDASASEILQSHQEIQKLKEQEAAEKQKEKPKAQPAAPSYQSSQLVSKLFSS